MTTAAVIVLALGLILALCGIVFSLIPGVPGPPLSALGLVGVQVGLWIDGREHSAGWIAAGVGVLLGLIATAVDVAAPQIADRIRKATFLAKLGSYLGMLAAVLLSMFISALLGTIGAGGGLVTGGVSFVVTTVISGVLGLVLFFAVPLVGATLGELLAGVPATRPDASVPDTLRAAFRVGLIQAVGLLITTVAKVVFGTVVLVTCIVLLAMQWSAT